MTPRNVNLSRLKTCLASIVLQMESIQQALANPSPEQNDLSQQLDRLSQQLASIKSEQLLHAQVKQHRIEKRKQWKKRKRAQKQQPTSDIPMADASDTTPQDPPMIILSAESALANAPDDALVQAKIEHDYQQANERLEKLILLRDLRRRKLERQGHFFAEDSFYQQVKAAAETPQAIELNDPLPPPSAKIHPDDHWQHAPLDQPAYDYWTQGSTTLQDLKRVRLSWDQYLIQNHSNRWTAAQIHLFKVPPTWVPPFPPSSSAWAAHLHHPLIGPTDPSSLPLAAPTSRQGNDSH
ncbi:hypothetical protein DM01DRAFT_1336535 [Hesseltinella vesiculosa]|uniref:Uncharacterized protein n=1 Tax=Hesseltinella vesiculosa TaxID=101127 RepID=A0A1X2GFR2_9FUNG|nr:hypothetical protein DM01DRAFT_1336535 [Hesseltinella vesiculosa]